MACPAECPVGVRGLSKVLHHPSVLAGEPWRLQCDLFTTHLTLGLVSAFCGPRRGGRALRQDLVIRSPLVLEPSKLTSSTQRTLTLNQHSTLEFRLLRVHLNVIPF